MKISDIADQPCQPRRNRRAFLGMGLGIGLASLYPGYPALMVAQGSGQRIDEDDPANIKLAHRLDARSVTEGDLQF